MIEYWILKPETGEVQRTQEFQKGTGLTLITSDSSVTPGTYIRAINHDLIEHSTLLRHGVTLTVGASKEAINRANIRGFWCGMPVVVRWEPTIYGEDGQSPISGRILKDRNTLINNFGKSKSA